MCNASINDESAFWIAIDLEGGFVMEGTGTMSAIYEVSDDLVVAVGKEGENINLANMNALHVVSLVVRSREVLGMVDDRHIPLARVTTPTSI